MICTLMLRKNRIQRTVIFYCRIQIYLVFVCFPIHLALTFAQVSLSLRIFFSGFCFFVVIFNLFLFPKNFFPFFNINHYFNLFGKRLFIQGGDAVLLYNNNTFFLVLISYSYFFLVLFFLLIFSNLQFPLFIYFSRDFRHEASYTQVQQQDSAHFAVARMYNLLHGCTCILQNFLFIKNFTLANFSF